MLKTVTEVSELIKQNKILLLAGEEALLKQLPVGNWIAGTIPYFMDEKGGKTTKDKIFVTEVTSPSQLISVKSYRAADIHNITKDADTNGYTFIIIPATSDVHIRYAEEAPFFEDFFLTPILGWISGVHLDDLGKVSPKVYCGENAAEYSDRAVAMHFRLPEAMTAEIGIVNVFRQGNGDTITFPSKGFKVGKCLVNGTEADFADYISKNEINTQLPLVANYNGVNINVSIQAVNDGFVDLYAPVFEQVDYKFAAPVDNYISHFQSALPPNVSSVFSCNCILNYLYSELEGKKTEGMYGPVTFGEVAYQLLNQTLVYLTIQK